MKELDAHLRKSCEGLQRESLWRVPRVVDADTIELCGNDYLGLATHPALSSAAAAATAKFGTGTGASRLVSGTRDAHMQLENRIANWLGTEAARLFNSGYQANVGALSALLGPNDIAFSDELNHASIIDGLRLSKCGRRVFPHADLHALESLLRETPCEGQRWIVSDSIFSMDGDIADVRGLCDLAAQYGAHVYIDEAHAVGVIGASGRGVCFEQGVHDQVAVRVGTCGKALGSFGAFVVGSQVLCDFLYNRARSFIYSTSLPPGVIAATSAAIELASADVLRDKLWTNLRWLHGRLGAHTSLSGPPSPIFPIMVGDNAAALSLSADLDTHGFFVQAIRPPTVPVDTARLRLTVSAAHEHSTLSRFADALEASMVRLNLVPRAWP